MGEKAKMLLRRAETYGPVMIAAIIRDGLREFGLEDRVHGRVTIKPNVVMAHHKMMPSAYTRPEFLDGLLAALESHAEPGTSITAAEKCGAAIPTSRMFRRVGYYKLRKARDLLGSCTKVDGRLRARHKRRIRGCPPNHKTLARSCIIHGSAGSCRRSFPSCRGSGRSTRRCP
jgi:hypothetical protein